jgi:hypothetical protein
MGLAGKFLSSNKLQVLSSAFDKTQELMKLSPIEAIQKVGITSSELEQAKSILNNPIAKGIATMFGADTDTLKSELNNVSAPHNLSSEQAPIDELERLRDNLNHLKSL